MCLPHNIILQFEDYISEQLATNFFTSSKSLTATSFLIVVFNSADPSPDK
jgi:hypothetical protein